MNTTFTTTTLHHSDIGRFVGGLALIFSVLLNSPVYAQLADNHTAGLETELRPVSQTLQPAGKDADSQVWQRIDTLRDSKGNTVTKTNVAYVEMQTGLHYREDGQWKDSREVIESYPGGAIARYGNHKVIFAENFSSEVLVDLETPDGKRLQSRVLGLRYLDSASGKSVLLAEATNSIGHIIHTNQVLYADAFSGVKASVRFTYTKAGLEQDVIWVERPATPESYGLDSKTTSLQVMTEFLSPPAPVVTIIKSGENEVGDDDQLLDFGAMQMGQGKAFTIGFEESIPAEVPVAKQWIVIEGRTILFEGVPVARIADQLEALPAGKRTAFHWNKQKKAVQQTAALKLKLPARKTASPAQREMRTAKLNVPVKGLVFDYQLLTGQPNVTLKGDTTYYVAGLVNLSGTTTIEGGSVIKYSSGTTARIVLNGQVVCQTDPYRPAIFTAVDDDSVGEIITPYSTGSPNGNYYGIAAFNLASGVGTNASLSNLRVRYIRTAIISGMPANSPLYVANCQFVKCQNGIYLNNNNRLNLRNSLFANIQSSAIYDSSYYSYTFVDALQVTFDQVTYLASRYSSPGMILNLNLTNCAVTFVSQLSAPSQGNVVCYGDYNGFYNSPNATFGSHQIQAEVNPFQPPTGAGNYYLADDPRGFRNKGTANIDSTLLADLKKKNPPSARV